VRACAGLIACLCLLAFASGAEDVAPQRNATDLQTRAQVFWRQAQDDLFAGLVLSADQQVGVDAIIAEAARDRGRAIDLRKIVNSPGEDVSDAKQRARAELQELTDRLHPEWRIDAMRALLSEEQCAVFDRNWRLRSDRLFAEERRRRRKAADR